MADYPVFYHLSGRHPAPEDLRSLLLERSRQSANKMKDAGNGEDYLRSEAAVSFSKNCLCHW
jgi:hypothetical protein